jgi:hypothetical protein
VQELTWVGRTRWHRLYGGRTTHRIILVDIGLLYLHLKLVLFYKHLLVKLTKGFLIDLQRLSPVLLADHVHVLALIHLAGTERAGVVRLLVVKKFIIHHFV